MHAAFLERSPTQTAKVEAFVNANSRLESTGRYDFTSTSFDVSNYTALRLKGLLRTSTIDGPGLMVASWLVTVRWNAGRFQRGGGSESYRLCGGRAHPL